MNSLALAPVGGRMAGWLVVGLASMVALGGCARPDPQSPAQRTGTDAHPAEPSTAAADRQRIDSLETRLGDLERRMQTMESLLRQLVEGAPEPDPDAVYSVPVAGLPYLGARHAKVTVVQAYEFACRYCAEAAPVLRELLTEYPGELKVVYAPFIVHADIAVLPALAVCAAHEQGKFDKMERLVWAASRGGLSERRLLAVARAASLDIERYRTAMAGQACIDSLRQSVRSLAQVGTSGTPTFYVNGRILIGFRSKDAMKQLIDEELAKANQAIAAGASVDTYYQKAVIESGRSSL